MGFAAGWAAAGSTVGQTVSVFVTVTTETVVTGFEVSAGGSRS